MQNRSKLKPLVIRVALITSWLCSTLGCSSSSSSSSEVKKAGTLDSCWVNSDCASGICVNYYPGMDSSYDPGRGLGYCTTKCDAGCLNNFTCGISPDGSEACVEECSLPNRSFSEQYGCKNNIPTACVVADETYCEDCGCDSSLRCEPGVGCQAKRDIGGACKSSEDCKSNNCSNYLGICRVPVWSSCTSEDCDLCTTDTTNNSVFCTKDCSSDAECNGGYCLGYMGSYYCHRPCSACTSGTCSYTSSDTQVISYCDCSSCKTSSAPRPLGTSCDVDANCASNLCYAAYSLARSNYGDSYLVTQIGACTRVCANDSDCSASGMVCAEVPCSGGDTTQCGPLCVHPCDADGSCSTYGGTCSALAGPNGATVSVCDIRQGDAAYCASNNICLSGRCTNGACLSASGAANGMSCIAASDCQSANCINGICKGKALIGDSCSNSADCSVGNCCSTTSKCATSC